jgi:hypothetical protein
MATAPGARFVARFLIGENGSILLEARERELMESGLSIARERSIEEAFKKTLENVAT